MKKQFVTLFATLALASCGGTKPKGTEPPTVDGDDDGSGGSTALHDAPDAGPVATSSPDATAVPDPAQIMAELLAAETAAYQQAKPVFEQFCSKCHQQGAKKATAKKLDHFDMTSYPFGGHHVAAMSTTIRHTLGADGAKPTMPADSPGSVAGDDLALVTAWADAWDAADDGGAHDGVAAHQGAHDEE